MNEILARQLALDYCCSPEDVADRQNHFTTHRYMEGRRRYKEPSLCFLKIAVVNEKLLVTGTEEILAWCRERYGKSSGEWFFEAQNLCAINDKLREYGCKIENVHPFFISERKTEVLPPKYGIRWYFGEEIEQFRGDGRFWEAFTYCPEAPDVVGVSASESGRILGMAGASADSPSMWQIGINVEEDVRGRGIAAQLVSRLKNHILDQGILPYYGTAMSHIASQRVALASGFEPAWAELITSEIGR